MDEFEQAPLERGYKFETMIHCLSGINANANEGKIMNYIRRQQEESYPGKSDREVLWQWKDYLSMCGTMGKDLGDALVSRPRELERRHDEAVEELRKRREIEMQQRNREAAERMEKAMREKFPRAEIQEIKKEVTREEQVSDLEVLAERKRTQEGSLLSQRFNYPSVLIYADPPYMLSTRHGKQYKHEMEDQDHEELLNALLAHKGPVVPSSYDCDRYNDRLRGWHREAAYYVSGRT